MPSPFPGMNPYLERAAVWRSFHTQFISTAQFHLAAQVQPQYAVEVETDLYIHEPPADRRIRAVADLAVRDDPDGPRAGRTAGTTATAPLYLTLPDEVTVEPVHSLVIRTAEGNEVVTVVELLSRTNKYAGPDREQYLRQRAELLRSRANLVEIDLLRGGPRMPPDDLPSCDYCALVSRAEERPKVGVWVWRVRDPIPPVPVPLRGEEAGATLDVKAVLDQVYDAGFYSPRAYAGPPEPRLSPDDAAWAAPFVPPPPA